MSIATPYKYAPIVEAILKPVLVLNQRGVIVFANKHFCELSGYSILELRTHNLSFFIPDSQHDILDNFIDELGDTDRVELNCSFQSKAGKAIKLHFEFGMFHDSKDTGFLGTVVAKKKKKEEKGFYKHKFELATKLAIMGVWEADLKTDKVDWSGAIYEIFEMSSRQKAQPLNKLSFFNKRDKVFLKEHWDKLCNEGVGYNLELPITLESGNKKWVRCIGKARKRGKKIESVFGSVQDISKVAKERLKLQQLTNDLSRQKLQMEQFNQIVSHNLRSPIANIGLLLNYYESSGDKEEREQYIKYLKQSSDGLHQMLEDLVDAVKILNTKKISTKKVNIATLFNKVVKLLSTDIATKKANITLNNDGWNEVDYAPIYLESILMNLISNSIKYSKEDEAPKIEVSTKKEGKRFLLIVSDNGIGIDLKKHGQIIFKLHKSINKSNAGKGLGLFMTKQQVEAMGGVISVDSELGQGTTFTIDLLKYRL